MQPVRGTAEVQLLGKGQERLQLMPFEHAA